MPKIILLPLSGTSADSDTLDIAFAVGRLFDAHLVALHVRPAVRDIGGLAGSDAGTSAAISTMINQMKADADQREHTASETWRAFCEQNDIVITETPTENGVTSELVTENGGEVECVVECGRAADLIVMGRGTEDGGTDAVLMEAALMNTGQPVLIASAGQTATALNGKVGIAWKDTREAAGAVRAARPFIRIAHHVAIFVVSEDDRFDKSASSLAKMLRWHNSNVTIERLLAHSRPPVTVLLDAAVQADCGLLVMGGYGHSRLQETVFGGFTRTILKAAPLPVLLAH